MRVQLVPATREDIDLFTIENYGQPAVIPTRMIVLAAKLEGHVLGIGGVALYPNGVQYAFVAASEEAKKYPVAFHRAGKAALELFRKRGIKRVVATARTSGITGERWLLRLGFEKVTFDGEDAYVIVL